jgi:hypothetical protein
MRHWKTPDSWLRQDNGLLPVHPKNDEMNIRENMKSCLGPWSVLAALVVLGWGWWGYGVSGDYSLELADAMRLSLGEIPYRDYFPTYGPLSLVVLAPLFALAEWALPAIWLLSAALIAFMIILVARLGGLKQTTFSPMAVGMLFVLGAAFLAGNSRYIMGYSTAGFMGVCIFGGFFYLLHKSGVRSHGAILLLGLLLFTKLDLALVAAVLVLWLMIGRGVREIPRGGVLFLLPALAFTLYLGGAGVTFNAWLDSQLEMFEGAVYIQDRVLRGRLMLLGLICLAIAGISRVTVWRSLCKGYQPFIPLLFCMLFAVCAWLDMLRIVVMDSVFGPIWINYFWFFVWVWAAAHFLVQTLRYPSRFLERTYRKPYLCALLLVGAAGIARSAIFGWFPLNYYQPAFVLLAISVLGSGSAKKGVRRIFFGVGLLALGVTALHPILPASNMVRFESPYGVVLLRDDSQWREPVEIYTYLQEKSADEGLLSTYMTGVYVLTGHAPHGIYTYWHRLAASGSYRIRREAEALAMLRKDPPGYVLLEKERATFAPKFGIDFGRELHAWVLANYDLVLVEVNEQGAEWRLMGRKSAVPVE